ncbi:Phosphotransferase system mannitol/fructose-specific IIA domain (Ntr-type) [Treponema sp. JC4]|uniref:PTS sugar transporter subunit IIA n=1 Tax=Treponema sp. JC4 TaxID=1124982 RepID=UPI00025B0A29|nr:PTS sugar transporter subunit IIA [Treponema sp. JC4]EID86420.1 Phosphotransferase system mannitol/fructose-specific IIA domain (Ntr-type) [Treponema sp. JC4]
MGAAVDIADMIHRGGVFELEGKNPQEVYSKITKLVKLPAGTDPEVVYKSLCEREQVLTTAVGNGIALPHTRTPVLNSEDSEAICVVYLKNPIDMKAIDGRPVSVMFVLLAASTQTHLSVLSKLAGLFNNSKFKLALERKTGEERLAAIIRGVA